jgi:polyphosphate glucokinase
MADGSRTALGVDVGGTGIKGAVVDLDAGRLLTDRHRIPTPQPSTPEAVGATIAEIAASFGFSGPVGVDFPGVILDGVVRTAANVDDTWIGTALNDVVGHLLPGPSVYLNDADAAGLAEVRYGAGRGQKGTVLVVTFGTGIGTALIHDGRLVPNAELGHIEVDGEDGESRASAAAREREGLGWEEWATTRATRYLRTLEALLWPELIILGGGISKKPDRWVPFLDIRTRIVMAELRNNAGIVGAALAAHEGLQA